MIEPLLIAFLGFITGAVFRTTIDFLVKKLKNEDLKWDSKYTASMVISIIISVMYSMVMFSTIQFPVDGGLAVFQQSLTIGFMTNHLANLGVSLASNNKQPSTTQPPLT